MAGFDYRDELMAEIYRDERMHEADVNRLVRHADAQKESRLKLFNEMQVWLGERLIYLGVRLQHKKMTPYSS